MKNSLLIHHNNVAPLDFIDKKIRFNLISGDVDRYITDDIIPQIKKINPTVIYIKDNLSAYYLELFGLQLAYHIRLSRELEEIKFVPIVIISDVNVYVLNRLTKTAQILFTKNIFISQNNRESIENFSKLKLNNLTKNEYKNEFLHRVDIEAPQENSHDISNEWAIYRWAEFLKINDSKAINQNREKIASMLYFKYLKAKYQIENSSDKIISSKKKGKVLFIDDEADKGWNDILEKIFPKDKNIDYKALDYNFKDKKELNNYSYYLIDEKIKKVNPDVVVLDLRLIANDNNDETDIDDFIGIKILERIHKINAGIQVIMLTATSKSTILDTLYDYKILGYIKKEHPNDISTDTISNINKFVKLVDKGLEKQYLKEIWEIQESILELNLSEEMNFEVKSVFEILDSDMGNKFNYAMFAIVKVIEIITNIYTEEKWEQGRIYAYWKNSENRIICNYGRSNSSTVNKIRVILDEKLLLESDLPLRQNIEKIIKVRNNTIHPKNNLNQERIDEPTLLTWFKMIQTILKKINQ